MHRVVHLGPSKSHGGMSTVIQTLHQNPPEEWTSSIIDTHDDSPISMLSKWFTSRRHLKRMIRSGDIDIAHIHVTHSLSWIRKRSFMRICRKAGLPTIVHIHSGKFDSFCRGPYGKSVKLELSEKNRKVIVLEKRWLDLLSPWISRDHVTVVPNPSIPKIIRNRHRVGEDVKILLLSRDAKCKGHGFAIRVAESLLQMGRGVSISLTGIDSHKEKISSELDVRCLGWVSNKEKMELIRDADIMLSPSEYEGSSMSVIEAIVNGLPCIVSEASGETVGISELIVSDFDVKKWASRIVECTKEPTYSEINNQLLEKSQKYSISSTNHKLGQLYDSLILNDCD